MVSQRCLFVDSTSHKTGATGRSSSSVERPSTSDGIQGFNTSIQGVKSQRTEHTITASKTTCTPGKRQSAQSSRVLIAIGSNVGDRFGLIDRACWALSTDENITLLQTSFLYETEPMYMLDQGRFINGVVEIQTSLTPMALLDRLQMIEQQLNRVKEVLKGPRTIDLDILVYGNEVVEEPRLTIPHALMAEREFVLRPLCDIAAPNIHPRLQTSYSDLLRGIPPSEQPMFTVLPLGAGLPALQPANTRRRTQIMSILNVTPDSFSDGGLSHGLNGEALKAKLASHIAAGATIIDIGGQSSRPHAADVTPEEELARVLPAIKAIKSLPDAHKVAISVDTYRASVAEAAVKAGAHIVNDISAGLLDADMLPTVARLGCTYVAMHMRGTPATMTSTENCSYPGGVTDTVADELHARVTAALDAGIRRWRIILDPGIGFAKNLDQNIELLRNLARLRDHPKLRGYPWLVGSSRKAFIGKITGVKEAKERTWGTAATVTAAVAGGVDIVRVHDVDEMSKVARMADAIYRS